MGIEIPKGLYRGYIITVDIFTKKYGIPGIPEAKTNFNSMEEASRFIEMKLKLGQISNRDSRVDEEN